MTDITKAMTDAAIVNELYERIETRRKNSNITQVEMAERIGITTKSYRAIQNGVCRLTTFVALLRQLDLLENLDDLISRPKISPLQMKLSALVAQRRSTARRTKNKNQVEPSTSQSDNNTKNEISPTLKTQWLGRREKLLIKDK